MRRNWTLASRLLGRFIMTIVTDDVLREWLSSEASKETHNKRRSFVLHFVAKTQKGLIHDTTLVSCL